jgi:hypothetical protein
MKDERRPPRNAAATLLTSETLAGLADSLVDLRDRFVAIVDELDLLDADVDVPRTIAEGGLEDSDQLLADVHERLAEKPQ